MQATLDHVFSALSDPTRRSVVSRLAKGPCATLELAKPFNMALPSFTQHLNVLEKCGLVTSAKNGRVRTYELKAETLSASEDWLSAQRRMWNTRLDQLDEFLTQLKEKHLDQN